MYVLNVEGRMHFAGRRAPWKVTNGAENLDLQAPRFQKIGLCRKLPARTGISR